MELEALQEIVTDLEKMGVTLVVISPQLNKYSRQIAKKLNLTFEVLGDPGSKFAEKLGLVVTLPGNLQELYKQFSIDLSRFNGEDSGRLPMPGRFIVNKDGIITSVEVHPDHTIRPEPTDLLDSALY